MKSASRADRAIHARRRAHPLKPLLRDAALCMAACLAIGLGAARADTGATFVGGFFQYSLDRFTSSKDVSSSRWFRSPLAVGDRWLMFRTLRIGGPSAVYVFDLKSILGKTVRWSAEQPWPVPRMAVEPGWNEILAQSSSLTPPDIPSVRALYRTPGFMAVDPATNQSVLYLATETDAGDVSLQPWEPSTPHLTAAVAGPASEGAATVVVATTSKVRVGDDIWFDCAKQPGCKAVQAQGIDWAEGRLALAYADAAERRWVCVIERPMQGCPEPTGDGGDAVGGTIPGQEPLLSGDGSRLAIPRVRRSDEWGKQEGWDLAVYRILSQGDAAPLLEPHAQIRDIVLVGAQGQGGDYVTAKGSYGWLGQTLVYLSTRDDAPVVHLYDLAAGPEAAPTQEQVPLPRSLDLPKLPQCEPEAGRFFKAINTSTEPPSLPALYEDLLWVPAAGRILSGDGTCAKYKVKDVRLTQVFAVQPFQMDQGRFVAVHGTVKFGTSATPLSRILIFALD